MHICIHAYRLLGNAYHHCVKTLIQATSSYTNTNYSLIGHNSDPSHHSASQRLSSITHNTTHNTTHCYTHNTYNSIHTTNNIHNIQCISPSYTHENRSQYHVQRLLFSATLTNNPAKLALLGIKNPLIYKVTQNSDLLPVYTDDNETDTYTAAVHTTTTVHVPKTNSTTTDNSTLTEPVTEPPVGPVVEPVTTSGLVQFSQITSNIIKTNIQLQQQIQHENTLLNNNNNNNVNNIYYLPNLLTESICICDTKRRPLALIALLYDACCREEEPSHILTTNTTPTSSEVDVACVMDGVTAASTDRAADVLGTEESCTVEDSESAVESRSPVRIPPPALKGTKKSKISSSSSYLYDIKGCCNKNNTTANTSSSTNNNSSGSSDRDMILIFTSSVATTHKLALLLQYVNQYQLPNTTNNNTNTTHNSNNNNNTSSSCSSSSAEDGHSSDLPSNKRQKTTTTTSTTTTTTASTRTTTNNTTNNTTNTATNNTNNTNTNTNNYLYNGQIAAISRNISTQQRNHIINECKLGLIKILITTDYMSRGIDLPNIKLVINYDCPTDIRYLLYIIYVCLNVCTYLSSCVRMYVYVRYNALYILYAYILYTCYILYTLYVYIIYLLRYISLIFMHNI